MLVICEPSLPPNTLTTSVLAQVVLSLKVFAADLTGVCDLGALVCPLVDHQVVGFREPPLAELADELALWPHLPAKVPAIVIDPHHREHLGSSCVTSQVLAEFRQLRLHTRGRRVSFIQMAKDFHPKVASLSRLLFLGGEETSLCLLLMLTENGRYK